jgi:multiple sugar transport system permease protein
VLQNMAVFTLATVIPSLVLPFALAILLDRKLPLRDVWRTAFILPSFISLVAAGLVEKLWC